jgi:hypothetical protein
MNSEKIASNKFLMTALTAYVINWRHAVLCLTIPGCLHLLLFGPEDGSNTFLRNVSELIPDYTVSHPRPQEINGNELEWKFVQHALSNLVTAFEGTTWRRWGKGVLIILPGTKHKLRPLSNLKTPAAYWIDIWTLLPVVCCRAKSVVLNILRKWKQAQAAKLRQFPNQWREDVLTQRSASSVLSMSSAHWPGCLWTNLLVQLEGKFCEAL